MIGTRRPPYQHAPELVRCPRELLRRRLLLATAPTPKDAPVMTIDALPGLAVLTDALRRPAALPGVLIRIDRRLGDNAEVAIPDVCGRLPTIRLGADLLQDDTSLILPATLAHEIAHQALGHPGRRILSLLTGVQYAIVSGGLFGLALRVPWQVLIGLALVGLAVRLVLDRIYRGDELAADSYAVTLLDQIGMPGRQAVRAMLADNATVEPRWHTHGGWILTGSPTSQARLRNLRHA